MKLFQLVQAFYDTTSVTYEDEDETLNIIFDRSNFIIDREEFAREHITQEDAEAIALSNKYFISDYIENGNLSIELTSSALTNNIEQLAYYITFSDPTLATQLLEELLYYRAQGRI